ncbi:MAG TPA: hypothetical protein GX747_03675 [Tenericutes bacterium]|nr:hypothetical protein [Mycoplasmatota bacterium]
MKKNYKFFSSLLVFISFLLIFQITIVHSNDNSTTIIYGDLNGDSLVNSIDLNLFKRYLLEIIPDIPNSNGKIIVDLDGNGQVNSTDYIILRKYILEIINTFPVENISPDLPSSNGLTEDEQFLFNLVNEKRIEANLEPLILDEDLTRVARILAQEMSDNYSVSPESSFDVLIRENKISYTAAGMRTAGNHYIERAVNKWLESEKNYSIILNSTLSYTGVAVLPNSKYGKSIVQIYIRK